MKMKTNVILIVMGFVVYWIGLCNASAFYDPGTQRWLNRDPLGELGFEIGRGHQTFKSMQLFPRFAELSEGADLYEFVRNNPNGFVDTDGLGTIVIPWEFARPDPIDAAAAGGALLGGGLLWAFPNAMTWPGKEIGNLACRLQPPFQETCFLAIEVDGFCIFTCPSGPRVIASPPTGCPIRWTFKFPNPLNPNWRP